MSDFMNVRCGPAKCHKCGRQSSNWVDALEHSKICRKATKDPIASFKENIKEMDKRK